MIKLENVTFTYSKNQELIQNLNLELKPGNIYGLLGKNGAGKTTLLKIISGMLFPQSGKCWVNGIDVQKRLPKTLADIYFIPEEFELPGISAQHMMDQLQWFYPKFSSSQFHSYLDLFKVNPSTPLKNLSFGQKKQVVISFGLATNTTYLLLDEPTNGLDIPSKSLFRRILANAITDERSFIISTHQVRDLDCMIDPILVLDQGSVLFNQSIESISRSLSFESVEVLTDKQSIWSEKTFNGFDVISNLHSGEYSNPDLEMLFKAVCENPDVINTQFTQK